MRLALIALRNLSRNRRRSLLSLSIVSVGTAGLLLTAGFVRYSFDGLRDAIIQGGLGHLEVAPSSELDGGATAADLASRPPLFSSWRETRSLVQNRPDVRAVGAAIQFAGVVTSGERSASFVGFGTEPDRERAMGLEIKIRGGADLPDAAPQEGEERALLGVGLARALNVAPGEVITVMSATPDGSLNAVDLTVDGLFTTGFQELDGRILRTHIATAQRLLGTDRITSLVVGLEDTNATLRARTDIRNALAKGGLPLSVVDWETRAPFYGQVRALYTGIFVFLGTIVALLVALSTSNTMLMSVLERVREFGTLLAIGTSREQLARMLILEALWLALLGGVAGSALGIGLAAFINALEINMPPPPAAVDPVRLALTVVPTDVLWALVFMAVILGVAAIPPMLRVFRLQIVDALGYV